MFIPVNKNELNNPDEVDFVLISSDAYVDHPTFGHALIARYVQSKGYSIGIIPQPLCDKDYDVFPVPKYAYLVSSGVVDSMVNNYTVAKKKRSDDVYSPQSKKGKRPDRQLIVYGKTLKKLHPSVPVIIGGIEASLRRFAHYDYWSDKVMRSVLFDSGADMLMYGMGEKIYDDLFERIEKGIPVAKIKDLRGTCVLVNEEEKQRLINKGCVEIYSFDDVSADKVKYAKAFRQQSRNIDPINSVVLIQKQDEGKYLVQNLPQFPMTEEEMDKVYALPYERTYHPMYEKEGGIKALEEVRFSVVSHRGCFGSCSFCAINYHQGRRVQKRSDDSIIDEVKLLTADKSFKGYIHDLSGPSANFREHACDKQDKYGVCKDRYCIGNTPCKNLKVDHTGFLNLLKKVRKVPKVKKVFIRSGIRYDYVVYDKNCDEIITELSLHHISGQLKVAPEHISDDVLKIMNKPSFEVYKQFAGKYKAINEKIGKKQYVVPYLISSHPGCTIKDAVKLTEYLRSINHEPEQVQDFYPTPSTRSTCMYYTGIDPDTMQEVYVPKSKEEKSMQRALLQYRRPENREKVEKAYKLAGVKMPAIATYRYSKTGKRQPFTSKTDKSKSFTAKTAAYKTQSFAAKSPTKNTVEYSAEKSQNKPFKDKTSTVGNQFKGKTPTTNGQVKNKFKGKNAKMDSFFKGKKH